MVVILAYRDRANAVLPLKQHEIDYANAEHQWIIVALETVILKKERTVASTTNSFNIK